MQILKKRKKEAKKARKLAEQAGGDTADISSEMKVEDVIVGKVCVAEIEYFCSDAYSCSLCQLAIVMLEFISLGIVAASFKEWNEKEILGRKYQNCKNSF